MTRVESLNRVMLSLSATLTRLGKMLDEFDLTLNRRACFSIGLESRVSLDHITPFWSAISFSGLYPSSSLTLFSDLRFLAEAVALTVNREKITIVIFNGDHI